MSESEKSFTVSDRRHFTAEGRPREDGEPPAEPATPGVAPPPRAETRAEAGAARPADFGEFLLSLGAQAGMLLSGRGLPEGTPPAEALEGARALISILEMLRDKSEGRRTPAEDEILDGLLFELRMAYVERKRAVAP